MKKKNIHRKKYDIHFLDLLIPAPKGFQDFCTIENINKAPKPYMNSERERFKVECSDFNGKTLTVFKHDYDSLDDRVYINDNIIRFYISNIYNTLTNEEKENCSVFDTFFYLKSGEKQEVWLKRIGQYKNADKVSEKKIIVPINDDKAHHWYLVILDIDAK